MDDSPRLSMFEFKGTTIGCGNLKPVTNLGAAGALLCAASLACNVLGGLLEPATRSHFESFCWRKRIAHEASAAKKKHKKQHDFGRVRVRG
jgi:hypothetical protein